MNLNYRNLLYVLPLLLLTIKVQPAGAQAFATVSAVADARQVSVGDRVNIFLNVQNKPALANIQWPVLPDSLPHLEILERGRIDTVKQGDVAFYKQRLVLTGFDSGQYYFPQLTFTVVPASGGPYQLTTDSFAVLVQTVPVDTTKDFKPIKGILEVRSTWRDYIWLITGAGIFLLLIGFVLYYFLRNKGARVPVMQSVPAETLQQKANNLLLALEGEQLWQKGQVKEYYVRLTDIVRSYVEARFNTPAMELTTDELIDKARQTKELITIAAPLELILRTADLAKFAKAQPLPQEHLLAMEQAKGIIASTTPVIIEQPTTPNSKA